MPDPNAVMHVIDSDDGATAMDIVRVPEGFSFQVFDRRVANEYQSVIATIDQMREIANFIRDHVGL